MKHTLDAKNLLCPLPVIRLQEKISQAKKGDIIKVIATDMGVKYDIPAWCKVHNHKIIKISTNDNKIFITVKKV